MFNVNHLIESGGILAVGLIIFAESGLLLGFFLPGDTLLFAAGVFAGQHKLSLALLLPVVIIAAIVGYQVGYKIGEKSGPRLFRKKDSGIFRQEYVLKAEQFFDKHGGKAIILARFIAVVRTFISVVAGASNMDKRKYLMYNIIGAVIWTSSITLLGVWLGNRVKNVDKYVLPLVGLAILASVAVPTIHLLSQPKVRSQIARKFKLRK